jgi:uncharacterized protein (TIGR02246 family)
MYRPFPSGVPDRSTSWEVESTIRELTQDFSTAFNTGNYDQAAALFAMDGLFMAPERESAQGQKAIERLLREYGESGYEDLRLETVRIEHSGDIAVQICRYVVSMRQANGTIIADRGKFLFAWRRLGAWLMTATCWNSNLPGGK